MDYWIVFADIAIFIAIVFVGFIYKNQIKSLTETVKGQKVFIESAKMITEMLDIPKIKEIYDEKMKDVEEKGKKKVNEFASNFLSSMKKTNKKWSDSTIEYLQIIAGALLYLKPKTREKLISRYENKHINKVMKKLLEELGDNYISEENTKLSDIIRFNIVKKK